jgi:hypothetical protein
MTNLIFLDNTKHFFQVYGKFWHSRYNSTTRRILAPASKKTILNLTPGSALARGKQSAVHCPSLITGSELARGLLADSLKEIFLIVEAEVFSDA